MCEGRDQKRYEQLAEKQGDRNSVLIVCGFWGQGPFETITKTIEESSPSINVFVVCGENREEYLKMMKKYGNDERIRIYSKVDDLSEFISKCGCIITKPGISTLLEAHAAKRKIFLLKGMPVAEDNNARYAIENFGAEWFTEDSFKKWACEEK